MLTNMVFHGKQSKNNKYGFEAQNQGKGSNSTPSPVNKMPTDSTRFEGIPLQNSTSSNTSTEELFPRKMSRKEAVVWLILVKLISLISKNFQINVSFPPEKMLARLLKITCTELEGEDISDKQYSKSLDKLVKAIYKDLSKKFGPVDVIVFKIEKNNPDVIKSIVAILKDNLTPSNKPSAILLLLNVLLH